MESMDSIIKFNHVSFKYNSDEPFALNDVSFDIPKGKWTSIVGHNGSGKSTVAKLMIGIQKPLTGDIYYNHQCINPEHLSELRNHIGIVFQNPENQFVGATVEYDVAFGLENNAVSHESMHEIVPKVLSDVDMLDRLNYEPQSLSGGQKQRVAIAGVLALNTEVIILDEATSMLDPVGRTELLKLIRRLNSEKDVTIISITHDLSEAAESDQMVVLNEGSVFQIGTPKEVFSHGEALTKIGLDLPFAMRINQLIRGESEYITYERLLSEL
ncbi:energy-coupling factor transporter ATPase [Staphylococcus gallinarum]|uniref:energy-coupling factor transporter ATPase n=1 Tax=Staphylococcus gallinarum TaxID=1293 RepID=UPI000D1EB218|nr:energy-coupling factor transporter ATPase [Staphylococcus gallinarum]PTK95898.1 energy-coupling factor transporter ATPase [Staphylococcus gallinarum]PTK96181.1 energy-coupling factor transporter ATPase [Staphylococcus gallinarum]RIO90062.1 energy-coupling factor transporter ATPase [Staphylococcus gallinarum]